MAKIVGLKGIDRAIKSVAGIGDNLNTRVQEIAVAIVEHATGEGNGDVSRALTLVQTVSKMRTLNTAFLVGWLAAFANCNVNLKGNEGKGKVSLHSKDSKAFERFGGFNVDGARANNWFDAIDADGKRAAWYTGPEPAEFQPLTIGDLAERMNRFCKNTSDLITSTKNVKGKEVPAVALTDDDKRQVEHAMAFIGRIAATLARHEDVQRLEAQLAAAKDDAGADEAVIAVINQDNEPVAEQEKAVA